MLRRLIRVLKDADRHMAKKRRQFAFQHIATVGAMLPTDVLERVANEDAKLPGLRPSDYGLAETKRLAS